MAAAVAKDPATAVGPVANGMATTADRPHTGLTRSARDVMAPSNCFPEPIVRLNTPHAGPRAEQDPTDPLAL